MVIMITKLLNVTWFHCSSASLHAVGVLVTFVVVVVVVEVVVVVVVVVEVATVVVVIVT